MTDLATGKTQEQSDTTEVQPEVHWAEPAPKKRGKKGLWLGVGIPVALLACGAVAVGTIFTAPGVTVLGADVGMTTLDGAEGAIAAAVADATVTISVDGTQKTLTGTELGLSVDAAQTARDIKNAYPLWKIGDWSPGAVDAELSVDTQTAEAALSEAFADKYTDPVNAQIEYNDDVYSVVPSENGQGIDIDTLIADLSTELAATPAVQALAAGAGPISAASSPSISLVASITETEPELTTDEAEAAAESLNTMVDGVVFTLDDDAVDTVPAKTVASWIDVTVSDAGEVEISTKNDEIEKYVAEVPGRVGQSATDADVVVDASGNVLKTIEEGHDGYEVTSTDGLTDEISSALTSMQPAQVALTGEKVAHKTTERFRRAVVSKSEGYTYFYETVNDGQEKLMKTTPMALGTAGHDTQVGDFTVYAQLTTQNMGDCDADGNLVPGGRFGYCTANVPWISYFNGDQGFHGTYWHNNFGPGAYMSHGCVNLTQADAEWTYRFLQVGSPVKVVA
jgi:lipoprotein-anchoring transpeptidase ErfK/SrfK